MSAIFQQHYIYDELAIASGKMPNCILVNKFGRNADVDAAEDVWDGGGDYTGFPTSTLETVTVISSSANDAAAGTGARTLRIYGLDANYALQQEDVTLNGTTGVATSNTYRRVYRAYVLTAGSVQTNVGALTLRHTTTAANIFAVMAAGYGQTHVTAYTVPTGYSGYLVNFLLSMNDNSVNSCISALWTRENGGAVRLREPFGASTSYDITNRRFGGIKILEKTDFVVRIISVQNPNADISCHWDMVLIAN